MADAAPEQADERMPPMILTHAGAGSHMRDRDGPEEAARRGLRVLLERRAPIVAACSAVALLEDDPRFNAGTGSNLRLDGRTIEMDAACADDAGGFGAVVAIRDVRNPILVAHALLETPHCVLAGEGATRYARRLGFAAHSPWTEAARGKHARLLAGLRGGAEVLEGGWDRRRLEASWNYPIPLRAVLGEQDTVGAAATDGRRFAAALSTGGTVGTLLGRVGDVPLPGCGLEAGPAGAVAATGDGEAIARKRLAGRVYRWLEEGVAAAEALERALSLFDRDVDVGLVLVSRNGWAGGSNRDMAWARAAGEDA